MVIRCIASCTGSGVLDWWRSRVNALAVCQPTVNKCRSEIEIRNNNNSPNNTYGLFESCGAYSLAKETQYTRVIIAYALKGFFELFEALLLI